jgi:F420-dependent oxidoreductase-like protein
MRHSFKVWAQQATWPELREVWLEADRGGFWDMVWLNDHLYPPKSASNLPIMDAWSLFGGLAAITERIRFGTMVSANTFRHPVILAKQAVTLDHMSNGRLEIGVGTGWHEGEHAAFGIDLPPLKKRFELLDETFEILDGLMTQEIYSFQGKHRTITEAHFEPKPVQEPRPPFVIGGTGPKQTIPLAAKWADQWNFPDYTWDLDLFRDRLALLDAECNKIGRDRSEIEVSVQFRYSGDLAESVERFAIYEEAGADHVLVSFTPPANPELPAIVAQALSN